MYYHSNSSIYDHKIYASQNLIQYQERGTNIFNPYKENLGKICLTFVYHLFDVVNNYMYVVLTQITYLKTSLKNMNNLPNKLHGC